MLKHRHWSVHNINEPRGLSVLMSIPCLLKIRSEDHKSEKKSNVTMCANV